LGEITSETFRPKRSANWSY